MQITQPALRRPSRLLARSLPALCLGLMGLGFAWPAEPRGGIAWEADYAQAFERAQAEDKVVFVAINMDGDPGNDRMVADVYTDRTIERFAGACVSLVASAGRHNPKGDCSRLGAIPCEAHRAVDIRVREALLKPDAEGFVIAPQHLWLDGSGKVLLSVPFEVTRGELEWCFHEAERRLHPGYLAKESEDSRPPRRWIPGGVFDGALGEAAQRVSREEALELIAELRKGSLSQEERMTRYKRLAQADEPEARKEIELFLKSGGAAAGGGKRGLGAARGANQAAKLMRWIGEASAPSYAPILLESIGSGDRESRLEAIVALEQLASPLAVTALSKQYKQEKDPELRSALVRALGASGPADRSVRSLLLKATKERKDATLRANAWIALGWLDPDEDVQAALESALKSGTARDQQAVLVAMGLSRQALWLPLLKEQAGLAPDSEAGPTPPPNGAPEAGPGAQPPARPAPGDPGPRGKRPQRPAAGDPAPEAELDPLTRTARAALKVHDKGTYGFLAEALQEASGDTIPRSRLFPTKGRDRR